MAIVSTQGTPHLNSLFGQKISLGASPSSYYSFLVYQAFLHNQELQALGSEKLATFPLPKLVADNDHMSS